MEQQYKTPEEIQEDLKYISPLALPDYLARCEYYDKSNAFEVLDKAEREFENQGGISGALFDITWKSVANSVGLILLRKMNEPLYRKVVKSKSTDFALYAQRAVTFTYDQVPSAAMSSPLAALHQDLLKRDMNRHPGNKVNNADGSSGFTPQLDVENYNKGKNYRDFTDRQKTETDKLDGKERSVQYNKRFLERQSADGKTVFDSNEEILFLYKEDELNRSKRAEADHIIPLQMIDANSKFFTERYVDLDKVDEHGRSILQQIVNDDSNFQVLAGNKNASKGGGSTNLHFIENCEKVHKAADIFKKMEMNTATPEEIIKLNAELKSLGLNTNRLRDAKNIANVENLSTEEQENLKKYQLSDKEKAQLAENQKKAENALRKAFLKEGSKTVLIEQIGKMIEVVIGPIGFEIRDSIKNGITHGFENANPFEAFAQRIWRALCYSISKLGAILKELCNDLAKMIATFFLNACKILQDFFGKFFDLALSGISVLIESIKVLMSGGTAAEKGDAILKIIVGFATGILGQVVIDTLLESAGVPEPFSDIIAAVSSAVIGSLVMTVFDRLDLFGVKRELKKQRIEELFALRSQKLRESAQKFDMAVTEKMKQQRIAIEKIRQSLTFALNENDFEAINAVIDDACELFVVEVPYQNTMEFMEFLRTTPKIVIS